MVLSLTGSAVANVLPFGGAAGIALNYRMCHRWGFERSAFGIYTLVTNLWNILARLSLPAVALLWLTVSVRSASATSLPPPRLPPAPWS